MIFDTAARFAAEFDALRRASGKSYRKLAAESGLAFATISGYCAGRHLPQLSVTEEFGRLLAALGVPRGPERDRWFEGLAELRAHAGRTPAVNRNPYCGLRSFEPEDAGLFFGRRETTARLVAEVRARGAQGVPLAVVGPSGSGKSSLLRAGLVPAVGSAVLMTPGSRPRREWARLGANATADAVVVVDQFEELFTLCADEAERLDFLSALRDRRGALVLGLRADFYDRALRYRWLTEVLRNAQFLVEPMTPAQVREAVVEPARASGLNLEEGLVELLLRDIEGEPGYLPLLSHTLRTICDLGRHDQPRTATIGVRHYQAAGGAHGAIARTADLVYDGLGPARQKIARNLFLRLVKSDDNTADTRRRVTFDELLDGRTVDEVDDLTEVLEEFIARRLLTADTQTVEISHEALLPAWPRLGEWLAQDRAGHHLRNRLTVAARTWRDEGRPVDGLYRGGQLAAVQDWAADPGPNEALNPLEREFLAASAQAETARATAGRRAVRRRYQLASALAVLLLVAAGTAVYAHQVRTAAESAGRMALSRRMAVTAARLREKDPALAAQLAVAAYSAAHTPEARAALLDSSARPTPRRTRAHDGTATTMAHASGVSVVGTDTGRVLLAPGSGAGGALPFTEPVASVALSADAKLVGAGGEQGALVVWDVSNPARPTEVDVGGRTPTRVFDLEFSPDGSLLATGMEDGSVRLHHLRHGSPPVVLAGGGEPVRSIAFSPDGRVLAAGGDDRAMRMWDVAGPPVPLPAPTGPTSRIFSVAISPDGRTLAAGTAAEHVVYLWDIADPGRPTPLGAPITGPASWINTLAFSPDGTTLAAGSSDTYVWRWDLRTRQPIAALLPHPTPLSVVLYKGDSTVETLATDGVMRTWAVPGPVLNGSTNQVFSISFDTSGHRMLVGAGDGTLRLWDMTDLRHATPLGAPLRNDAGTGQLSGASALSADGATALGGGADGGLYLWDVTDPQAPRRIGDRVQVARKTVQAIAFSPDGTLAAVSSDDGNAYLLDVSDREHPTTVATLSEHTGITYGVRFSPDGRLLAIAAADAAGHLWDVTDRRRPRLVESVTGFTGAVYATAFSADGSLVAFGGTDHTVRLVDLGNPSGPVPLGVPLIGPVGAVYEMAFHPKRPLLAIGSIDRTIWLWDLRRPGQPELTATLTAAEGGLFTTAFSPDGHTLAAAGRDEAVRLWDVDPEAVVKWVCGAVGESITREEWAQFVPEQHYDPPCR